MRQPSLLRSYAVTHPAGPVRFPQEPGWHQFVYARSGIVRLTTPLGSWTLPPQRALWIAAGVEHRATVLQRTSIRTLYAPTDHPLLEDPVTMVQVSPFVREAILRIAELAPMEIDGLGGDYWSVLAAEVRSLDVAPLLLPAVRSEPAVAAARRMAEAPARHETVDEIAFAVGVSRRTLERQFRTEAGVSVGEWWTRARLSRALELLAVGAPVGRVAVEVGYSTQSAFGAMFLRRLGVSPGRYFADGS